MGVGLLFDDDGVGILYDDVSLFYLATGIVGACRSGEGVSRGAPAKISDVSKGSSRSLLTSTDSARSLSKSEFFDMLKSTEVFKGIYSC